MFRSLLLIAAVAALLLAVLAAGACPAPNRPDYSPDDDSGMPQLGDDDSAI
jgi:hypothetical protein